MSEFLEFLTSSEMIIVGIIAVVGCFLGLIVYIFEKTYYKRKQRHNTKELNNLVGDISNEIEKVTEPVANVEVATVNIHTTQETPKVTTIEEALSVAEDIEVKEIPIKVNNNVVDNAIEKLEEKIDAEQVEINKINSDNEDDFVEEDVIEKLEEQPLVIPIEEYEASRSISDIYTEVKEEVENLETEKINQEKELKYTNIEPNKEEAIAELKKVTENLIKKEEEKNQEIVNIELTKFEEEQEENAIISMDELLKRGNELYEKNEVKQYEDEGDEPISLQDLELRMNNIKEEIKAIEQEEIKENIVEVDPIKENNSNLNEKIETINKNRVALDDLNTIETSTKAYRDDIVFKSSPIISPIFGIEEANTSNDMMLENTANYDKFDEEIKKTNEFIVTLKELQEKLD